MRILLPALVALTLFPTVQAQKDWPVYGHDPGGMRYSPMKQINPKNVAKLREVIWEHIPSE